MYEHTVQCNAVSRGRMMRTGTAMQQLPAGTIIRCRYTQRTAVSCEQPRRLLDKRCSTKSLYITSPRVSASRVRQSPASRTCVPTPSTPHRSPLFLSACLSRSSPLYNSYMRADTMSLSVSVDRTSSKKGSAALCLQTGLVCSARGGVGAGDHLISYTALA